MSIRQLLRLSNMLDDPVIEPQKHEICTTNRLFGHRKTTRVFWLLLSIASARCFQCKLSSSTVSSSPRPVSEEEKARCIQVALQAAKSCEMWERFKWYLRRCQYPDKPPRAQSSQGYPPPLLLCTPCALCALCGENSYSMVSSLVNANQVMIGCRRYSTGWIVPVG